MNDIGGEFHIEIRLKRVERNSEAIASEEDY